MLHKKPDLFILVITNKKNLPRSELNPFCPLCFWFRVGSVCHLWNTAAASPVLWRKVTVSHCWIAPGKKQLPKTENKIKDTFNWLAQIRSVLLVIC